MIEAYAAAHRLRHRTDTSNRSPDHTRNRLRLELLPLLCEIFGRDVSPAIARAADIAADDSALLDSLLDTVPYTAARLPAQALRSLPPALARRAVHRWLAIRGVPDLGFAEVERTLSLLAPGGPAKVNLPGDLHVRRRAGELFIERPP